MGISGGVDSAVSLALLKQAGFDVTGVFIRVWEPDWLECSSGEDRREAMRVAAHLGVPFVTLDLEKEYKTGVIDYMIEEYRSGRTPNPDVMCNRQVKFGAFFEWARKQGADCIATGHYARVTEDHRMLVAADPNKDQTYFLWTLSKEILSGAMFPIGAMTKPEVRRLALELKLPNAKRKDSQGLCFIGKVDVKDFLAHYISAKQGDVLDENGNVIGSHPGALFFTIGERHGFTVTDKTPNDAPLYTVSKDMEKNTITVSPRMVVGSANALKSVLLKNVNWISGSAPDMKARDASDFPLEARSRYRQELQRVRIVSARSSEAEIEFEKPQETITPGQSVVIYRGGECLGGGIIA